MPSEMEEGTAYMSSYERPDFKKILKRERDRRAWSQSAT